MDIKCFMIEHTGNIAVYLRRYASQSNCGTTTGMHDEMVRIENRVAQLKHHGANQGFTLMSETADPDDTRWPSACHCGYKFSSRDTKQTFTRMLYRVVSGDGSEFELDAAPVGSMWYSWYQESVQPYCGSDGKALWVRTPGGDWHIDGRATNCNLPNDSLHRCWVRHGVPPDVTVDKNGLTCAAGAGSISMPKYHGFLRNGVLTNC